MSNWKWYSGTNEEYFSGGPFDTREEAVEALEGEAGCVIEATKPDLRLAQHLDFQQALEELEENFDRMEEDRDVIFEMTKGQEADLIRRLQEACEQWQTANNLTFTSCAFGQTGGVEFINGPG